MMVEHVNDHSYQLHGRLGTPGQNDRGKKIGELIINLPHIIIPLPPVDYLRLIHHLVAN